MRQTCAALDVTLATLYRQVLPFRRTPGNGHRRFLLSDIGDLLGEQERLRQGHTAIVKALAAVGLAAD